MISSFIITLPYFLLLPFAIVQFQIPAEPFPFA
jgi:hypothetical protein